MTAKSDTGVRRAINRIIKSTNTRKTTLMVLSCVVVFITTYLLILPAITLDQEEADKQGGIDVPAHSVSDADRDYEITADFDKAGLPEDVELTTEEITGSDQDYNALYQDALQAVREDSGNKTSDLAFAKFYDITLYSDGERIEPDGPVDVTISYDKAPKASDAEKVRIVHFALDEDTGEVVPEVLDSKRVEAEVKGGKLTETTFEATSFSIYAIVYTVDFEYDNDGEKYTYSIEGGGKISLADLLLQLKVITDDADTEADEVQLFMGEIDNVEFSSPKLVHVSRDNDDWTLTSLKPFDSTETLTVTMKNGDVFIVKVTDAQEISDSEATTIDVNKSYLICYEVDGVYYLLKNDGSVKSGYHPDFDGDTDAEHDFEHLNSTFCWNFNFIFKESDVAHHLNKNYYLIRPIDNKTQTLSLNNAGEALIQQSNNNVAVIQNGSGFVLEGYHNLGTEENPRYVHLGFDNDAFVGVDGDGVTVHIYEMDSLPTYDYTVRSADEGRGTVTVSDGTEQSEPHQGASDTHYYKVTSNNDKMNDGVITAVPVDHKNNELHAGDTGYGENKWLFDHWEQDGLPLDRDQYPATIAQNSLSIPLNGSKLIAYFKQNPNYVVPASEKEPSSIADMTNWLSTLKERDIPLDAKATKKTAEVYDYENRIYRVDFNTKTTFQTFSGNLDMAFCLDVSNSMKFPSKLEEADTNYNENTNPIPIYQINDSGNQNWLDTNRGYDTPYYLIADASGTATVFKIYYKEGYWRAIDASRTGEYENNTKRYFEIGQEDFSTNYGQDARHPFSKGDDDNSTYVIYDAGDNGLDRFHYLNESLGSGSSDLNTITELLQVAGDASPNVKIAYNTFNKDLGTQRQDFRAASTLQVDFSHSAGGGTRPDQAFNDAQNFSWTADYDAATGETDRYVILVTDGAPQGLRTGESAPVDFDAVARTAAQNLKDNAHVKFITIGLSMENVESGKRLLYDLADKDQNGNKMFYLAESASDLLNIFRHITKTLMEDVVVYGNITDKVGEAFYLIDKSTGLPLKPGDKIDIEGCLTADESKVAGVVQSDGETIVWENQAIDTTNGWHGTAYVKAKEDLIGGNAVKTNDGEAQIVTTKYRAGGQDVYFDTTSVKEHLKLTTSLPSPLVNVNELTFPNTSTEWTVYLGTEVDPEKQLKKLYEDILVEQVINTDDSLHYVLKPNSISDDREDVSGQISGTPATFPLAPVILEHMISEGGESCTKYLTTDADDNTILNWDAFLEDILKPGGVTVPYHPYGINGEDSNIVIALEKNKTFEGSNLIPAHNTDSTGNKVETYTLTVKYNPDYRHVLPTGQGGTTNVEMHTGTYGSKYQGHATGRETSTNEHVINVYSIPLDVYKTDQDNEPLAGATFKLYKVDSNGSTVAGLDSTKKYTQVASGTSGDDGIARLETNNEAFELKSGETYYLVEDSAPEGYNKVNTVWTVEVQTEVGTFTDLAGKTIHSKTHPIDNEHPAITDDMYPFNWDQGARVMLDGNQPVTVIARGDADDSTTQITDGSFVSHEDAIAFRHTVQNLGGKTNITVNKTWEDENNKPDSVTVKLYRVSDKDHNWGEGKVVPCTCTGEGVEEYTCSECGKKDTHVISAAGHTPGTEHRENEVAATCKAPGSYDKVVRCKVCNAIISSESEPIPAKEHTWVNQKVETADPEHYCYDTADVCSVCGAINETSREYHDHDWGDWVETTPAQAGVAGEKTRICNHDSSHIETAPLPPLTSITYRAYRDWYSYGRVESSATTQAIYPVGSTVTLNWTSNADNTTVYINSTRVDAARDGAWPGHDFGFVGGTTVQPTRTGSNPYNYSVTVTVTENMVLDLKSNRWDYYPQNIQISAPAKSAASTPKFSLKSIARNLLNTLFDGDGQSEQASLRGGEKSAETSMTSEELSEYLSGMKNKTAASCRENEDHVYKEEVDTYTIKADDNWTLPINDLPKYNEYGKEYAYYVVEEDSTGAYTITYLGQTNGLHDGDAATINNKQKPGSLKISKSVAVTEGSAANLADGTYTFEIWNADGTSQITKKADGSTDIGTLQITVTDGVANPATLTVDGLNAGTYVLKETASTNTGTMIDTSVSGYDSSLGGIAVTVSPNDIEGVQTAAFTNKYETTSVTVKKEWDDNDSSDRPESLTVTLLADGELTDNTVTLSEENDWEDSIDGLPKYKDGAEIDYHWLEGSMPDGYFLTDVSKDGAITTLTNKLLKYDLKTSYTGIKTWDDDGNKYSTRPHELTVTLYADREALSNEPVWNYDVGTNQWAYTFENLPVFSEDGTLIHYSAEETVPGGYTKSDELQTPTTGQFGTVIYENGRDRVTPDNQIVWELGSLIDLSFVAIKPTANGDVVVWTHRAPVPSEKTAITNAIREGALPGCQNRNIVFYSGTGDVYTPHGYVHVAYDQEHLSVTLDFGSTNIWSQFIVGQFNENNSSSYNIGTTAFTNELETTDISGSKTWAIEGEDIPENPILTLTRTVTTDDGEGNTTTSAPETVTVTIDGNPVHLQPEWTGTGKEKTFSYADLPKYDQNGNEYTYSVAEASFVIGTGEDAVTYTAVKAADGTYTVTADKEGAEPFVVTQEGNAIVNSPLGTGIEIIKVEEGNKNHTLSDAQFQLTRVNEDNDNDYSGLGAYQSEIQTVDPETGRVFFSGLKPGRYRLDEILPPEGYILLETPWFIRVDTRGAATLEADYLLASVNEDGENSFFIENTPGPVLPEAGGPGTVWIYLIGSLLLLGCGIALVTRRRMRI